MEKSYRNLLEKEIEGIERNIKRTGKEINLPSLSDHLKKYVTILNTTMTSNIDTFNFGIDYIPKLCSHCNDSNIEKVPLIVEYLAISIHIIRFSQILQNKEKRKNLSNSLIFVIQYLGNDLKEKGIKCKLNKPFAYLLNEIIRVFLNVPELIDDFIIVTYNKYLLKEEEDFIIFSNLLLLLLFDRTFEEFDFIKYVRRSLIVYLSFDKLSYSQYLYNSKFVEVLVIKLCNLYEVLPNYFELNRETETLEVSINMKRSFGVMTKDYFSMVDYVRFLCKIVNCIVSRFFL